ncbi:MAG: regulatory protein RecX [Vicinamibacterales bacterium]
MSAYVDALTLLGRRELSERQLRQRLARKGHAESEIDEAIARLTAERALDDRRTADAIARTEALVRRRGRLRVRQALERAGIAPGIAKTAIDAAFADQDEEAAAEAALVRRLREDRPIADDREFQRLYRYLVSRGFESDRALRVLRSRRRARASGGDSPEDVP